MKKTYFEQLTELLNSIENPDVATKYVMDDVAHRSLSWRDSHE